MNFGDLLSLEYGDLLDLTGGWDVPMDLGSDFVGDLPVDLGSDWATIPGEIGGYDYYGPAGTINLPLPEGQYGPAGTIAVPPGGATYDEVPNYGEYPGDIYSPTGGPSVRGDLLRGALDKLARAGGDPSGGDRSGGPSGGGSGGGGLTISAPPFAPAGIAPHPVPPIRTAAFPQVGAHPVPPIQMDGADRLAPPPMQTRALPAPPPPPESRFSFEPVPLPGDGLERLLADVLRRGPR